MIAKDIIINLPTGLEARPIALLVQVASQYESEIYIVSENKKINAKSIMGMMGLGMVNGDSITITAEGCDQKEALERIDKYLNGK